MEKDLANKQILKERVAGVLNQLKEENLFLLNTTDPECAELKDKQTFTAGYNMQTVVDDKHGLIVHTDVVAESNDSEQFADLKIHVVDPSQRQALKEPAGPFSKDKFAYDAGKDCYVCPQGQTLRYICTNGYARKYRIQSALTCRTCVHFGKCTPNPKGRMISRLVLETAKREGRASVRAHEKKFGRSIVSDARIKGGESGGGTSSPLLQSHSDDQYSRSKRPHPQAEFGISSGDSLMAGYKTEN